MRLWIRGTDPLALLKLLCSLQQTQTWSQETRGQKVTGLGVEGGVSIDLGQKNAIIQEMIEEFLQDWPNKSFSLNSGGLRMPSAQSADSSVDPLWPDEERRVERASFPYKSRSLTLSLSAQNPRRGTVLLLLPY